MLGALIGVFRRRATKRSRRWAIAFTLFQVARRVVAEKPDRHVIVQLTAGQGIEVRAVPRTGRRAKAVRVVD